MKEVYINMKKRVLLVVAAMSLLVAVGLTKLPTRLALRRQ